MYCQIAFSGFILVLIFCFSVISSMPYKLILSFVHFLWSLGTLRDMGYYELWLCYLLTELAEPNPHQTHTGVCLAGVHFYSKALKLPLKPSLWPLGKQPGTVSNLTSGSTPATAKRAHCWCFIFKGWSKYMLVTDFLFIPENQLFHWVHFTNDDILAILST